MSGGHLEKFKKIFRSNIILYILFTNLLVAAVAYLLFTETSLEEAIVAAIIISAAIFVSIFFGVLLSRKLYKPTDFLARAIFHISPNEHLVAAPDVTKLKFGKELIETLTRQIYNYAYLTNSTASEDKKSALTSNIVDGLPTAIIGLDVNSNITYLNKTAITIFSLEKSTGLSIDTELTMKFNGPTLSDWLSDAKTKSINSSNTWSKVEIASKNGESRSYYDIAAMTRQGSTNGIETLLVLFDHSEVFDAEEKAISLIALSVHEIRTPLTILRGYVELLKQETVGKVDDQTREYIERLSVATENLTSFMANILSVAKSSQSQLSLDLSDTDWNLKLSEIITSLQARAKVRGKVIQFTGSEGLPQVAADVVSLSEVITNLVDNAIKYSIDRSNTIYIQTELSKDGQVLTTVRDEGVGIPDSVVPNLFNRFYRNHRNRKQVAGTGLGLYISKEIVTAHHGNIWVSSKEGQGTTIGFTLIPYDKLDEATLTRNNIDVQQPVGYIKNHSMVRK